MKARTWCGIALLAAAGWCAYGGPALLDLGFYHDDWFTLSIIHFAPPSLEHRMATLANADATQWFRPLDIPLWCGLYALFGLDPLPWQAFLLLVNVGGAVAAAQVAHRYGLSRARSLLAGLLFLAYPSKDANLYWPLNVISPLSLLLALAAHLRALAYIQTGREASRWAAAGLYLASVATYDQTAFLPAAWLAHPRLFDAGVGPRARRAFLTAGAALAAFFSYKFLIVPFGLGIPYSKTVILSPWNFVRAYLAGINSLAGPELIQGTLLSLWRGLSTQPLAAVAALALPWLLISRRWEGDDEPAFSSSRDALVLVGALMAALAYLPVALSAYVPAPLNHQNRINLGPALGLVLAAGGCVSRAGAGRPSGLILAAGVLLAAQCGSALSWAESYRRQVDVWGQVLRLKEAWPADKTLLVRLPERYVDRRAPVFDASWDITGAVRLWTGDARRRARTLNPRMRFEPDHIREPGEMDIRYDEALVLDVAAGTLVSAGPR